MSEWKAIKNIEKVQPDGFEASGRPRPSYYVIHYEDGTSDEPYNVANCREFVSIRHLANTLATLYSREGIKVVLRTRESSPGYLPQKDAISTCPSTAKLERLGWQPAVSLEEGFSRTVEYIRRTRNIR